MNQEEYERIYQKALLLASAAKIDAGSFIQELADELVVMLIEAKPQEDEE